MDIGPVSAIRPVVMVRPGSGPPDLSRVSGVQNQGHSDEDEYTSAEGRASRGLEDEDDEPAAEEAAEVPAAGTRSGKVNFFA